ncbi:MAG: trans-aconitate 2-methyltransferase [Flavobacteriaceae bacterium]
MDPTRRQQWSADTYRRDGGFVADLGAGALDMLDPRAGERILDLGCGDGRLTARIAAAGADVVGVDTSPELLERARELGLDARLGDGENLAFDREFDAVFSNAALHWMLRADAVLDGVFAALKPGGRFVAEFGGHGNLAAIIAAIRYSARLHGGDERLAGPWFYPTAAEYAAMLERHGFTAISTSLHARPTPLPTGLKGWLSTFRRAYFEQYEPAVRAGVLDEIEAVLEPVLRDRGGVWSADYMRIRVHAARPV